MCAFDLFIVRDVLLGYFDLRDLILEGRLQLDDCFILALIRRIEFYDLIR